MLTYGDFKILNVVVDFDELETAYILLSDPGARRRMGRAKSLFGDGKAALRIAAGVAHFFGQGPRPGDWKG